MGMRPLVSKYSLNKGIEILHLVDLFIVGAFLELLGSLLAFYEGVFSMWDTKKRVQKAKRLPSNSKKVPTFINFFFFYWNCHFFRVFSTKKLSMRFNY